MKRDPTPALLPPPIAANGMRVMWSTCVHFRNTSDGTQYCAAPGQSFLFPATACVHCKQFARQEP